MHQTTTTTAIGYALVHRSVRRAGANEAFFVGSESIFSRGSLESGMAIPKPAALVIAEENSFPCLNVYPMG